ncbi:MAG: SpoIIE family protein phosphatase [Lachnospiraceae bacterium]|nr:SpoIIE family protein phosphatase [Lachnospiraceae bacterium]
MKEILVIIKEKRYRIHILYSAVLFLVFNIPFRLLLGLLPYSEVRPSNMIPPVLGILWGPPGAVGTALMNMLLDIFISKSPVTVWLPGVIINFFYAYLPYKMWYGFGKKPSVLPKMERVSEILRYIAVILVDSTVTTTLLLLAFEHAGERCGKKEAWFLFFNNFDFAILLGVPFLIFLSLRQEKGIQPEWGFCHEKQSEKGKGQPRLDLILALISLFGTVYYVGYKSISDSMHPKLAGSCLAAGLILLLFYTKRPYNTMEQGAKKQMESKRSIGVRAVIGFLLLSVVFVLVLGILSYFLLASNPLYGPFERWTCIYRILGIGINVLFVVTILFLWYVEKNITKPLTLLTEGVEEFARTDHQTEQGNEVLRQNCIRIRTSDELQVLAEAFSKMTEDILSYVKNLSRVTAEKEKIGAELSVAAQIQTDLLPNIFPAFPQRKEFQIFASMYAAREVGGDFYDFFLIDESHLALVMADVSGKGVPAALFMVIAKTLIKNNANKGKKPSEIFYQVNNQLCEGNKAGMFVTAWMGIMEIASGHLIYTNAGHTRPLLCRSGQRFDWLTGGNHGFVLAGMEQVRFQDAEFDLEPDDILFLYTDGVTEAHNCVEELYGEARLRNTMNERWDNDIFRLLSDVKEDVDLFSGEREQFDDITMLAVQYEGEKNSVKKEVWSGQAVLEQLDALLDRINRFYTSSGADKKKLTQLCIAFEELFVNVVRYAYTGEDKKSRQGDIKVTLLWEEGRKSGLIKICDWGVPYNPLAKQDPRIKGTAEQRPMGGLGIYMVRRLLDNLVYCREDGENRVTLIKNLM